MKTLRLATFACLISISLQSLAAFASQEPTETESVIETNAAEESGSVCLKNYKKRRDGFAVGTAVTPVAGVGATVVGAYGGGLIGATALAHSAGGWGGLVGAVAGMEIGGIAMALTSIGIEIGLAVELAQAEKMYQLVKQVEAGSGKAIDKSYKKFIRKHSEFAGKVSQDQYVKQIFDWDQSQALCDGSLKTKKPKPNETKLRKLLATPKELDRALVKAFSEK